MCANVKKGLVLTGLIIIAISLLTSIILLIPAQPPPAEPDLIRPTGTLPTKILRTPPTQTVPSATPTSLLRGTVTPMDHQAIYLIQLRGAPDSEQRRLFVAVLNQTLNRPVEIVYEYSTVYNGFAVKLTPQEAAKVAKLDQVRQVLPDARRFPQDQSERGNDQSTR